MSDLLKINVNAHTERKNNLTYLSWAWAWAEVLKVDAQATWEAVEFDGLPVRFLPDGSAMVKVIVTIKAHAKSCWLPVMDHKNKAIKNPDAFAINTAIVRCLTKTISIHGLGLYIYAGEDMPEETVVEFEIAPVLAMIAQAQTRPELDGLFGKHGGEATKRKDAAAYQEIKAACKARADIINTKELTHV
jgi:hypothetical protein